MKDFQKNVATATNDFTNSMANETSTKVSKKKDGTQKRPAIPAMWQILKKAQKTFTAQLVKSNENKLNCISMYQSSEMNDIQRFWGEFMKQVDKLLDSRKYLRECKLLGYDAVNVAEHIVFLGSAKVNKVLKNGVEGTLGNDLILYGGRLSPKEADVFRERIENLLGTEQAA